MVTIFVVIGGVQSGSSEWEFTIVNSADKSFSLTPTRASLFLLVFYLKLWNASKGKVIFLRRTRKAPRHDAGEQRMFSMNRFLESRR